MLGKVTKPILAQCRCLTGFPMICFRDVGKADASVSLLLFLTFSLGSVLLSWALSLAAVTIDEETLVSAMCPFFKKIAFSQRWLLCLRAQ
jgi:hypothetical protein